MSQVNNVLINENNSVEVSEPLPFPFNQRTFCKYEPVEKRIEAIRVVVVDDLLRDERDMSETGRRELGRSLHSQLTRERQIAQLAVENILNNIDRLVKRPQTRVVHLSEVAQSVEEFQPDAIVLSGTLRDFDYYNQELLDSFGQFIRATHIPVLGICGGHQLIGLSFGARVVTLDHMEQHERRIDRPLEYQYRFIRIVDTNDPIFAGIRNQQSTLWQNYTTKARILRVWQNHGLQLDGVPDKFRLLATAYLCRNQMMVKRADRQLIYTVQYHLEKSFEDWHKNRTRWEHPNESRDGRIIFENFLNEALKHKEEVRG